MDRELKRYQKILQQVRSWQDTMKALPDDQLSGLTQQFRKRLEDGETEDQLLPEAFAAMCEADERILNMAPFDVQILGGIALHEGCLAEMGTGEGKTLVATLPLYLNALTGEGAILVTTNDYLALRDYEQMEPVFRFMGLTVAVEAQMKQEKTLTNDQKRVIYRADIVYTTHGTLGFDYLFNNLVRSAQDRFMRPFHYVIVDEADSVLLDSAQTPLVISGSPRVQSNLYQLADTFVTMLEENTDYETVEGKVWLTTQGVARAQTFFQIENFYDNQYFEINRHVNLALRAHVLFQKERDYTIAQDGKLMLLDSGTGRILPGVKLRGGQHQAIEVKEGLKDSMETRSVASITYQNLFRLFPKMAGMSGTILDNKDELLNSYGTKVIAIPPNKPVIRRDLPDVYFATEDEKFDQAIQTALKLYRGGRPVLIVVSTIAETERVSQELIRNKIAHNVLNANNAYWEAGIIKEAGQMEAVTVATAMAGRGTDIKLGQYVEELGGLAVIGIGRMASKRLERQVRGRAGRQGDPGSSQFFVALTDDVVKRNQIEQVEKLEKRKKPPRQKKIQKIVNKAQSLEEEYATRSRRMAMDYDRVVKKQRSLIYELRNRLLDGGTIPVSRLMEIAEENIRRFLRSQRKLDRQAVNRYLLDNISYRVSQNDHCLSYRRKSEVQAYLMQRVEASLQAQKERIGSQSGLETFMRIAVLSVIDDAWVEEVDYLQQLQSAVLGRSVAQKNLVNEYQNDAFESYRKMELQIKQNLVRCILLSDVYMDADSQLHVVFR